MSALYLILSQLVTKGVTFGSNQVLLRNISPQIFGMFAYLDFFLGSVLFLSREAQRIAGQRITRGDGARAQLISFSYMPLLLAAPISAVVWASQRKTEVFNKILSQADTLSAAVPLLALSVATELLSEPFFAVNQYRLGFRVRSQVESAAVLAKCSTLLGSLLFLQSDRSEMGPALLAYAWGQMANSAALYAGYAYESGCFFPWRLGSEAGTGGRSPKTKAIDPEINSLWLSLNVQIFFKHILTEGDTLILSYLFSISQQGVYSVICNYGSILARILFQPIEESVRLVTAAKLGQKDRAGCVANMQHHLVFYWNLSLLIILGGYTNGAWMLRQLIGSNPLWSSSPVFQYFSQYMVYLPFLAFNGVLEGFFSSASTSAQMGRFSAFLSVSSLVYFALLVLFLHQWQCGIPGLIFCNIVNMCLRIGYCGVFYWRLAHDILRPAYRPVLVPLGLFSAALSLQLWLFLGQTETPRNFVTSVALCAVVLMGMVWNERARVQTMLVRRKKVETKLE